ncbi:rhomboid family intramembrane serine protease [Psychroserpens sp. SPM9]|uniref:rhomboid family intramembrane serine protease n=1 Tax=Psychroserpens sp. SPM9 TaxID=2975598 RepID=UPI0021A573D2|nr:rhomboid family intramembrane serine protease [Psychroserpens sp. SPM9]MDG5491511.1 rhomboid family intramembrane serine protease [Psychroserpens sp. SPM9]
MSLIQDLKYKYKLWAINEKYMFINVLVFGIIALIGAIYFLATKGSFNNFVADWFALHSDFKEMVFKPWTFFSYFFLHFGFMHLFGNMIGLYFFGRVFLTFFNVKQFVSYYILGGLFAGLIFAISYNVFPALVDQNTYLVGASASVFSVLFGATAKAPNYTFNLFGMLRIPLWVIAGLYTLLFLSSIPLGNTGGELAHLGGAFFGYFMTYQLEKGRDISKSFQNLLDWFSQLFSSKTSLKTVHKSGKSKVAGHNKAEFNEFNKQKKVDLILDKISKSGYESLTEEEKAFLFKAGKD